MKLENKEALKALDNLEHSESFIITVDYGLSLEELMVQGRYDEIKPIINSHNFPPLGKGIQRFAAKLIRFSGWMNYRLTMEAFAALGLYATDAYQLIALGNQYPDLQKQYVIAEFGQTLGFDGDLPILLSDAAEYHPATKRYVGNWVKEGEFPGWCFAVIPSWIKFKN